VTGGPTARGLRPTVAVDSGNTVGTIGPIFAGFSYEKSAHHEWLAHWHQHEHDCALQAPRFSYDAAGSQRRRGFAPGLAKGRHLRSQMGSHSTQRSRPAESTSSCGFLAAAGSKAIYGVNFQSNDVTASTAEATYVMGKCPSSIVAIEIGSEPR